MSREWFFSRGGKQCGPVSAVQLAEMASSGHLSPADHVWKAGMAKWVPANKVKGIFPLAPPVSPPVSNPLPLAMPAATNPQSDSSVSSLGLCPHCQQTVSYGRRLARQVVSCPHCREQFTMGSFEGVFDTWGKLGIADLIAMAGSSIASVPSLALDEQFFPSPVDGPFQDPMEMPRPSTWKSLFSSGMKERYQQQEKLAYIRIVLSAITLLRVFVSSLAMF